MLTMRGVAAFALLVGNASALNNGLGRTPPMGFNVRPTLRLLLISCLPTRRCAGCLSLSEHALSPPRCCRHGTRSAASRSNRVVRFCPAARRRRS
jgi:hypothetical protein